MNINENSFGSVLKKYRLRAGLSLGGFAKAAEYDVSNLSKIERDLLPPPPSNLILRKWANLLNLKIDSQEYFGFLDTAASTRVVTPEGLTDKELKSYMPAFYRTIRNKSSDRKKYDDLIRLLKKS